ncbi:hypothetical protein C2E20_6248 [Micractinium conductrix]|uniref:GRAM domain-containing protein n=1 Tax=Micractinium conductrix TaxID=554055 RepID=A0A2P6V8C2_9CHLO|nr:hypothetical protein C2E20_6248 [Micractinium conductrix]|eukprot:PSC70335.1 hypothetical protein C2E20_6248 [Micractinium conductrix]
MSSFEQVSKEDALEDVALDSQTAPAEAPSSSGQAPAEPARELLKKCELPAVGAAKKAAPAPAPPPATAALASVLGFFGGGEEEEEEAATGAAAADKTSEEDDYDAVAAFEAGVTEMVADAASAADEVGHKLLHGAAEAKESLASLAQGLTSWWSTLDPAKPGGGGGGRRGAPAASAGDLSAAVAALGLEAGETVLESFSCQLWQSYTATNNFFTPVRQVAFPGSLHVTSSRLCFAFDDKTVAPIKLPGRAIKGVAKLGADAAAGLPERIDLTLDGSGQSLVLADFALQQLELDSALALLEHLAEL